MAWRFRLGSRRGEAEGTGVQVAEDLREEPVSPSAATDDSVASAPISEPITAVPLDLAAISEIAESSSVAAEAEKNETGKATAELTSDSTVVNILAAEALANPLMNSPTIATAETLLTDATEPIAPAFPALASDWAFEEKLSIHKEWVESQGLSGQKINLASAKLEGAELVGVNLRYADLQEADLKAADLLLADLRDTCLARANLEETCLVGANLEGANMEGAALATAMGLVPRQIAPPVESMLFEAAGS